MDDYLNHLVINTKKLKNSPNQSESTPLKVFFQIENPSFIRVTTHKTSTIIYRILLNAAVATCGYLSMYDVADLISNCKL